MLKKIFWVVSLIVSASLISGCNASKTVTLSPTISVSNTPAPTITHTPTKIITATPSLTMTPTLTPIATLSPEEALEEVSNLFSAYPDECQLPCFWRITPGKTSWHEASNTLSYFSTRKYISGEGNDSFFAQYHYIIPNEDWPLDVRLYIRHEIVETIKTKNINSPLYSLPNILNIYGAPDQIWITTFKSAWYSKDNTVPFMVFLLYSKSQFLVSYELIDGVVSDEQVTGCVSGDPSLYIWSTQDLIEFQDILKNFSFYFPDQVYLRLFDATKGALDEEKFYSQFKNQDNEACINTSADFWTDL